MWNEQRKFHARKIIQGIKSNSIKPIQEVSQRQVYHILPVIVKDKDIRSEFETYLTKNNIPYGIHYPVPIHKMPFYSNNHDVLPITESYADKMISLPIHPFLSDLDINLILNTINQFEAKI